MGKKYWKIQGILSAQKSGNPVDESVLTANCNFIALLSLPG